MHLERFYDGCDNFDSFIDLLFGDNQRRSKPDRCVMSVFSQNTWVALTFSAAGPDDTLVRMVHTGFLEGPDWDDYMAYFDDAWAYVLGLLQDHWDGDRSGD